MNLTTQVHVHSIPHLAVALDLTKFCKKFCTKLPLNQSESMYLCTKLPESMFEKGAQFFSFLLTHMTIHIHNVKLIFDIIFLQLFIGLGFPFEGPGPLEAIANGAVFLNPKVI